MTFHWSVLRFSAVNLNLMLQNLFLQNTDEWTPPQSKRTVRFDRFYNLFFIIVVLCHGKGRKGRLWSESVNT
jgi:hypothetical protein